MSPTGRARGILKLFARTRIWGLMQAQVSLGMTNSSASPLVCIGCIHDS